MEQLANLLFLGCLSFFGGAAFLYSIIIVATKRGRDPRIIGAEEVVYPEDVDDMRTATEIAADLAAPPSKGWEHNRSEMKIYGEDGF